MSPTARDQLAPLIDLVASGVSTPGSIARTALRYQYAGWEEPLAHLASDGALGFERLLEIAAGDAPSDDLLRTLRTYGVYAVAHLVTGQVRDDDYSVAADLFALGRRVSRRASMRPLQGQLDIQTHLAAGRHDYVRDHLGDTDLDPWVRWAAEADMVHPSAPDGPGDLTRWHPVFNEPFTSRGLAAMTFVPGPSAFDTVTTGQAAGTVDGPLVSIVMPVFKPSESLLTAVGSLVRQTWRNLQVILVDDASPAGYESVFERACALDDRVQYVRMPSNGGAYRARNHGLSLADGEIAGIQDGDDWSHPQRIERQMRHLHESPHVVATLSKAVRLHSDLRITKVTSVPYAYNAPSLLFRKDQVLGRLVRFDELRKAADTEFIERIAAFFGRDAIVSVDEPLALYQLTGGSLSRDDFRLSWHHHARVSYHGSFRHWHRRIAADGLDPVVERPTGRAFPAPPELLGTPYPNDSPDVTVLADWRAAPVTGRGLPALTRALAGGGLSVGLARSEPMRLAKGNRAYAGPDVQALLAEDIASWTPLDADLTPRLLLVHDVDLVMSPREVGAVAMRPSRVVVAADRLPFPEGSPRISYDPAVVESVVRSTFGTATEWLPATAEIAASLVAAGATGTVHPPAGLDVVDVARFPRRAPTQRPVVGVLDGSTFPVERVDRERLATILPASGVDVRILDPTPVSYGDSGWLSFGADTTTITELADQCDLVLGLGPQVAGASVLRPVLEAMARGCAVLADPTLRPVLGDAVAYLDNTSIADLLADGGRRAELQARALAFCQERWSATVAAHTVGRLLDAPTPR